MASVSAGFPAAAHHTDGRHRECAEEDLYCEPLYYPQDLQTAASSTAAASPSARPSLRSKVPYLRDLTMSSEVTVYQPPHGGSAVGKMMSLGVKTISGISKSLSFVVPQLHSSIAEWDDGSAHKKAQAGGIHGASGGSAPAMRVPAITVSCEQGPYSYNFYELKQNRGTSDSMASSVNEDWDCESVLGIPPWLERSATPEEIAVERQFSERAADYEEMYWKGVEDSRRRELSRLKTEDSGVSGGPRRSGLHNAPAGGIGSSSLHPSVRGSDASVFARTSSVASSITEASYSNAANAAAGTEPHRRASMTLAGSSSSGSSRAAKGTSSQIAPKRWNSSQKVDAAFKRETSVSSVSSSVLEHSSQASSSKGSTVPHLRKGSAASLPQRRSSLYNAASSSSAVHRGPQRALAVAIPKESSGIASIHIAASPQRLGTVGVHGDAGASGDSNNALRDVERVLVATPLQKGSTKHAADDADAIAHRATATVAGTHENSVEAPTTAPATAASAPRIRPPIPWVPMWTLPASFLVRSVASDGSAVSNPSADGPLAEPNEKQTGPTPIVKGHQNDTNSPSPTNSTRSSSGEYGDDADRTATTADSAASPERGDAQPTSQASLERCGLTPSAGSLRATQNNMSLHSRTSDGNVREPSVELRRESPAVALSPKDPRLADSSTTATSNSSSQFNQVKLPLSSNSAPQAPNPTAKMPEAPPVGKRPLPTAATATPVVAPKAKSIAAKDKQSCCSIQ